MKKNMFSMMLITAVMTILTACSKDNLEDYYNKWSNNGANSTTPGGTGSASAGSGELTTFTIDIDKTTAEPTDAAEEYFPDEEDALEGNEFTTEVNIDLSNPVAKTENGVEVTINGGHITANHGSTKKVCYVVSGTTSNGSFTVLGDKKYEVKLNGVNITNPDSAALNLLSGKRAYIVLADETTNTLTDGTSSKNDHKGALYCKGKLLFNGSGSLKVNGNYNNGIHSADYIVFRTGNNIDVKSTANHGIKANDGIYINGGILNVEVSAAAAKGINCESHIVVCGGRTTVITSGNGTYDTEDKEAKGSAGIKADSTFTMYAGIVKLKSTGSGGKGLNVDMDADINGGELYVITEGGQFKSNNDTASPKGIKVDGNLTINGGKIMVRTKGYNGEGIETKSILTITDGNVMVSAYDDAINSAKDMYIKGGTVTAIGTNNDGIDANGNMYIQGGTVIAFGAGGAETGIDIGEQYKLYISGGNIFGIGGRIDANIGSTTQGIASTSGTVQANSTVTINSGTTTIATFTMPPYSYTNGTIMVSVPDMKSGSSYTLNLGNNSQTITASTSVSSGMGGGNMPGGRPGGW
jgi:hypothetical protein